MRYTRILAAIVFTSSLIFTLCITSFAAPAYNDSLYCSYGVAYFAPMNSSAGKWKDYNPIVNDSETVFTFSSLPATLTEGNYEYAFRSFAFLMNPNNSPVQFENGYVYTYDFQIRSTRNTDPSLTAFQFGVCKDGFVDVVPLADVIYTYDKSGSTTVNYYVTVTLNVDASFPANSIPHPDEAFLYLQIATEWTNTFTLTASRLSVKKSVGEGAYYQASLDAIENLPNTEYDFTLNKMPDAEGTVETIKGDIETLTGQLQVELTNIFGVFTGISGEEPLVYMPPMNIPILNLDLHTYMGDSIDEKGYFHPLALVDQMDGEANNAIYYIDLARKFLSIVLVFTFCTVGIEKMIKVEWWF